MRKRNHKGFYQKGDYRRNAKQVLMAAVIGTALLSTSFSTIYASDEIQTSSETEHMIPDIITVDALVSLNDISLPSSSYGKLKWANPDQTPSESGESFEVILVPDEGIDLSEFPGWDEEEGVLKGYTEIVLAFQEEAKAEEETPADISEEKNAESEQADVKTGEEAGDSAAEAAEENTSEEKEVTESKEETAVDAGPSEPETEKKDLQEEKTEPKDEAEEETEKPQENVTPSPEEKPEAGTIFDEDVQPEPVPDVDLEEEMTEEEKAEKGRMNHSSSGITVSGPNLPWYVQFRVYDAEGYNFSIEGSADIFKSYEFVLWDLQNDCEYEIPDGDYVSVVVPVMTGYEYTVEHILDSGAVETIVPTMVGSNVVFSTHSLSPFGIAGSVNIVGGEVGEENYVSVTPTPTPAATKAPAAAQRPEPTKAPSAATPQAVPTIIPQGSGSTNGNAGTQAGESYQPQYNSGVNENSGNQGSYTAPTSAPSSNPTKTNAVQTGDETPILGYVGMLLAAGALLTGLLFARKRA